MERSIPAPEDAVVLMMVKQILCNSSVFGALVFHGVRVIKRPAQPQCECEQQNQEECLAGITDEPNIFRCARKDAEFFGIGAES